MSESPEVVDARREEIDVRIGPGRIGVAWLVACARITSDPSKMAGVSSIRGLRFPVATVVAMVADGMTNEEILSEHPDLEVEDISEALRFAALAVRERQLPLLTA